MSLTEELRDYALETLQKGLDEVRAQRYGEIMRSAEGDTIRTLEELALGFQKELEARSDVRKSCQLVFYQVAAVSDIIWAMGNDSLRNRNHLDRQRLGSAGVKMAEVAERVAKALNLWFLKDAQRRVSRLRNQCLTQELKSSNSPYAMTFKVRMSRPPPPPPHQQNGAPDFWSTIPEAVINNVGLSRPKPAPPPLGPKLLQYLDKLLQSASVSTAWRSFIMEGR